MFTIITIIWSHPYFVVILKIPQPTTTLGEFVGSGFHLGNLYIH
jgi:hypothetical protein